MFPAELKYAKTHEWVRTEEAADVVTMGLTAFAVEQLGDVVFLELPSPGDAVKKGSALGTIESVKAAVDLYSSVTGQVVQTNQAVVDNPDSLAEDPYGQGWLVKIKTDNAEELDDLMNADQYERFTLEDDGA